MHLSLFGLSCLLFALSYGTCKPLILTPLLEADKIKKAQQKAKVSPSIGNITSYSGYFTTNKTCGNNLFFWFFPALENWESAPVAIWLQGGPGSSSLFGLFVENGPFKFSKDEGLRRREYSWNNKTNMIYIDQPVGTGFSFSKKECYVKTSSQVSEELYSAIVQFFKLFPSLKNNRFFLTGQSFAGHVIPGVADTIINKNKVEKYKVNLSGAMIGNGWIVPREHLRYGDYVLQLGLIAYEELQEFYYEEKRGISEIDAENWIAAVDTRSYLLNLIEYISGADVYNYLPHPPIDKSYEEFLQLASTQKAIHIKPTVYKPLSMTAYENLNLTHMTSVKPLIEKVLPSVPIVFYTGQLDIICAYPMLMNAVRSFNWSGQNTYLKSNRSLWIVDGQIAGYLKGDLNLFDVLVRAAGHNVPYDQPSWAYQLFNNFTSGSGYFDGKLSTMPKQ